MLQQKSLWPRCKSVIIALALQLQSRVFHLHHLHLIIVRVPTFVPTKAKIQKDVVSFVLAVKYVCHKVVVLDKSEVAMIAF